MKSVFGWAGLGRPGSDLLFRVLRRSTIGAERFHGRVRDGIGCYTLAKATRPAKTGGTEYTILTLNPCGIDKLASALEFTCQLLIAAHDRFG